jgi:hypothetical protein
MVTLHDAIRHGVMVTLHDAMRHDVQWRIQGPYYPALARASGRPERLIILFIKGKITMISL